MPKVRDQYYFRVVFTCLLLFFVHIACAQKAVKVKDSECQHIFSFSEIEGFEDTSGKLAFSAVVKKPISDRFIKNATYTPKTYNSTSSYWFKIKIGFTPASKQPWLLEFFDQSIDKIELYEPLDNGKYKKYLFGDSYPFKNRQYQHKNFTFNLNNSKLVEKIYYIRVQSSHQGNVVIVLRTVKRLLEYAIEEYLFFGLFYGMILVFGLYNLLMFFAVKQKKYLYYVLYNFSIGFYEMCMNGLAFQYLYPNQPFLNAYISGCALFASSLFGLLFTLNFLYLKSKAPKLYKLIWIIVALRTVLFMAGILRTPLFTYKVIDIIPLIIALSCGIYIWKKKYKPARFFVIGYSFLLAGVLIKLLAILNFAWLPYGPLTYYSLSFCFVMEMFLVSFAIGDNIRHLRMKKDKAQKRIINQLQVNEQLKDKMNRELSSLVEQRTKEVVQKAAIIEKQNEELFKANELLLEQAEDISTMNVLLQKDNQELTVNFQKVARARVMSQDVNFNEFSKIYPDRETCFKYLSDLKWGTGFTCRKCSNLTYMTGHLPYSRRCTKCRYEESVIACTIFQNSRIPINKAFYMLFLVYSTKGKISSHKLSEMLDIRQGTCWAYASKMKKALEDKKKELRTAGDEGWSKLVLE